jgi:chaperonin GroES
MKYQPLNDYVLLKKTKVEEKTKGGLYKPDTARQAQFAEVVAVGPGIFTQNGNLIEMRLKVGDKVILDIPGSEVRLDGEKYVMVRESEILIRIGDE